MGAEKKPAPVLVSSEFKDPARGQKSDEAGGSAEPERQQWGNKAEFVMSCISLSVGLGNVWRFPYLAYVNGGGAFLIPYFCLLFLIGKPMYFMEIAFGQFQAEGPVRVWKRSVPLAKGLGLAQVIVNFCVAVYYVTIMAWTMYYFWATFISLCKGDELPPWATFCNDEYAYKETCVVWTEATPVNETGIPDIVQFNNDTSQEEQKQSSAQQYFDRAVVNRFYKGTNKPYPLESMGDINLLLLASLSGCWAIVYLSVARGVKSSGKVVYITSTMPFIVLFILLIRGATLENAVEGIKFFIIPKFEKLLNVNTWRAAAEQMFFSLNVAFGSLTMLGSYNHFNNNCYQDGLIVSILDSFTSVISGLAMFSVLGYLAGRLDVGIENVVNSGPGLAFVTFPEAVTQMPVPHLWGLLFFIMLFTLGLGSLMGLLECVLTYFVDRYPALREKRPIVAAVVLGVGFLISLSFITQGGMNLFLIFDNYAGGMSILFVATFEIIALMWIYGMKRFANNLIEMMGEKGNMGYYFRSAWVLLSPLTLLFIVVASVINYKPTADASNGLPAWADGIGWLISGVAIIQIPIWAGIVVYQAKGDTLKEKFLQTLWPDEIMVPRAKAFHISTVDVEARRGSDEIVSSGKL